VSIQDPPSSPIIQPINKEESHVNKTELIETLSGRLGDRKAATAALDAVLNEIQEAVTKGDKVSITGFGVFEKRVRAARTARNPRTGESVKVKKTSVPAFRPGATFKELVAAGKLPKAAPATKPVAATARKTATAPVKAAATAKKTTVAPAKAAAVKTAPVKAVKSAPVRKAAPARTAPAKTTTAKTTAAKTTAAKPAPARTATAKKAPARAK
jgi:DNA-binding protein HU-beta